MNDILALNSEGKRGVNEGGIYRGRLQIRRGTPAKTDPPTNEGSRGASPVRTPTTSPREKEGIEPQCPAIITVNRPKVSPGRKGFSIQAPPSSSVKTEGVGRKSQ